MSMNKKYIIFLLSLLLGCSSVSASNLQNVQEKQERFQGRIKMGMTKEQVIASWGEPDKIIKKHGEDFDEIWVYVPHWKFKNYLYFRDGILVRGDPNPENLI